MWMVMLIHFNLKSMLFGNSGVCSVSSKQWMKATPFGVLDLKFNQNMSFSGIWSSIFPRFSSSLCSFSLLLFFFTHVVFYPASSLSLCLPLPLLLPAPSLLPSMLISCCPLHYPLSLSISISPPRCSDCLSCSLATLHLFSTLFWYFPLLSSFLYLLEFVFV